ncbi:hypothetical protein B0H14DRAFT_2425524, partial [Mycena olivaceomarginata]
FLIDGLDECDTHHVQVEILCLIGSAANQHPNRFQFLIASRPEAHIREILEELPSMWFSIPSMSSNHSMTFKPTSAMNSPASIARHWDTMRDVLTPWPSLMILGNLVQKSSGYFIYVSIVIKFIDDKYSHPTERLEAIQNMVPIDSDSPFEALDQLYMADSI